VDNIRICCRQEVMSRTGEGCDPDIYHRRVRYGPGAAVTACRVMLTEPIGRGPSDDMTRLR
jgi:hypothetical protein